MQEKQPNNIERQILLHTLDAFIAAHQSQFRLDDLPLEEDFRMALEQHLQCSPVLLKTGAAIVCISYVGGGVLVREVDLLPTTYRVLEQPTLWSILPDLLRGVREIEFLSRSREEWEAVFGGDDGLYELRQRELRDAKILFGLDYFEFAASTDYDDEFLYLAGREALVMPKVKTADGRQIVVVSLFLLAKQSEWPLI